MGHLRWREGGKRLGKDCTGGGGEKHTLCIILQLTLALSLVTNQLLSWCGSKDTHMYPEGLQMWKAKMSALTFYWCAAIVSHHSMQQVQCSLCSKRLYQPIYKSNCFSFITLQFQGSFWNYISVMRNSCSVCSFLLYTWGNAHKYDFTNEIVNPIEECRIHKRLQCGANYHNNKGKMQLHAMQTALYFPSKSLFKNNKP